MGINSIKRPEPCPVCGAEEIPFLFDGEPDLEHGCGLCLEYFFEHGGKVVSDGMF